MAGTPGYPWPPYSSPSTHEGESQRAHLEAALRMLREQRPQIAAEIGEYLYSLVLQGQMRDPIVLATCRRLYDHEQQILQVEASLRALPAAPFSNQPPASMPPIPSQPMRPALPLAAMRMLQRSSPRPARTRAATRRRSCSASAPARTTRSLPPSARRTSMRARP